MTELPLLVIDVQRAGPSTGMPTKTEQADLNQALFGRHGEMPAAGARGPQPGRLLRRGLRGMADRRPLYDPGAGAERRLHCQRLGALADPRSGSTAADRRGTSRACGRRGLLSILTSATTGSPAPGPCRGLPG